MINLAIKNETGVNGVKQGYFDYNQIISISITYGTVKYQLYTMYTAFEISFGYMKQKSLYQVSYTYNQQWYSHDEL